MNMTKKDYELIAAGLKIAKPNYNNIPDWIPADERPSYRQARIHAWDNTCKTVANMLNLKDGRFKFEQFLKDCGVTD